MNKETNVFCLQKTELALWSMKRIVVQFSGIHILYIYINVNWTTSKKWRAKENVSKSQTKINYYYGIFVVHVAKVYWIPNVFLCAKVPILFFCFSQFFVLAFGFFSSLCLGLNPTLYFSFALFFLFHFPAYVCFCVCCVMIATSSRLPMCIAYIKLFQHRRLNLKKKKTK